jgi:hypothetical protein
MIAFASSGSVASTPTTLPMGMWLEPALHAEHYEMEVPGLIAGVGTSGAELG